MSERPSRRPLASIALAILVATVAPASVVSAEDSPKDPMRMAPTCIDGRATVRTTEGLPLVVGPCGESGSDVQGPAPEVPEVPASGPLDCVVPGYDDRCEAWTAPRYDGPWPGSNDYPGFGSFDRVRTVIAHPSKDLVFVGGTSTYTNGGLPDADFVEIAYRASTGQPVWATTLEGIEDRTIAYQTSFALSPDGERLYAVGTAAVPGVYSYASVIAAFDTDTGRFLWGRRTPSSAQSVETASVTLPDETVEERIFVGGVGRAISALDPSDGSTIWTSVFPRGPHGARFNEIAVSPDGSRVFATGGEHRPDGFAGNFTTVAFDAIEGEQLWVARDELTQPDGFFGNNGASDLKVTPDGSRVIIAGLDPRTGTMLGSDASPILTVAYEAGTGERAWRRSYGGPVEGETHFYFTLFQGMMDLSPDGRTVVLTAAINSHNSTGTVAYDVATGAQKWGVESVEYAYVVVNHIGYYPSVVVSGDRAYVSNRRGIGYSQFRAVTTAYDLGDGNLDWTARLGTNRTLFGGSALTGDRKRLVVASADHALSPGFPAPNVDTLDILTAAYDA
ncbi:MAG TPA: PQQ-binding-like beta-propeller repeat protein [Actinomycetota bacterium]|nr:PQQ-binding-like beta-propeller repeat protein [Actinomycetota bacterium]